MDTVAKLPKLMKMLSKQQNVKYGFLHVELLPFINCFPLFSDSPGIES
jgi:hypothetical protein